MFPHYPRTTVERDLARTGSAELTIENILSGALPLPPPPVQQSTSSSSTASSSLITPLSYLKGATASSSEPLVEPPKVWEQTAEGREANLRARKEHMVRLARERALKAKLKSTVAE
ncbi:hypothetical protein HK100_005334 [Physocladia obscura]|uniref:CUE domain-containing protein n=1 Tax=Physocladia obscura TaxID=109957 RepID=A0AAD5XKN5_9FUNG|nr:hypothetical protein HK100_005334 [Physocladia obscura]